MARAWISVSTSDPLVVIAPGVIPLRNGWNPRVGASGILVAATVRP